MADDDLLPRPRDAQGNRGPWRFHYATPIVGKRHLKETPLWDAIQAMREWNRIAAAQLHHFYDERLIGRLLNLFQVRREEEQRRCEHNARALRENPAIETKQEELIRARDEATRAVRDALVALDEPLAAAHRDAAEKVALTGGVYDPANPDEACVLREIPRPLEAVAADLGLPWTPADAGVTRSSPLSSLWTMLIGVAVGLSLALVGGFMAPDEILSHPLLTAGFAMIGMAVAFVGREAIQLSFRQASQRYYLSLRGIQWVGYLVVALGVAMLIVWMDSLVERAGLLANMRIGQEIQALARSGTPTGTGTSGGMAFFAAAALLTLPYAVANAWKGYLLGRADACRNRITARQGAEFAATDTALRARTEVQAALAALARVKILVHQQSRLVRRIEEITARFETEIAQREARRLPFLDELSEAAKQRVQGARDDVEGAQIEFDWRFANVCVDHDPSAGWMPRAWRLLFGFRRPRRRGRARR